MIDAATSGASNNTPHRRFDVWVVPVAFLVILWLVLAFSYGGFQLRQWLPAALVTVAFGLVAAGFAAFPRRPRPRSMVVLGLFFVYALWTALSATWAASVDTAWTDAARTFFYLVVLGLALTYLTDEGARVALRYLLLGGALVLLVVVLWRLGYSGWGPGDPARVAAAANAVFSDENRLMYPVSYPNNAAALFLVLFWPLLWMAADPQERFPVRVVGLATGTGLLSLALLTQSRGGLWAFVVTLLFLFVLSPTRLRLLLYLCVPLALTVWAFPDLTKYLEEGPEAIGYGLAVRETVIMVVVAGAASAVLFLLERRVHLGPRTLLAIGASVLLILAVACTYEAVRFDHQVGGTGAWLGDAWHSFTAEEEVRITGSSAGRFGIVSARGRWDIWRVAWSDFAAAPLLGVGAGNFVFTYDRLRSNLRKPQQPHSEELRALAETGAPGGIALFGSVAVGLGSMLLPRVSAAYHQARRRRTSRQQGPAATTAARTEPVTAAADYPPETVETARWGTDPGAWAWNVALAAGVVYWWVHGGAEWLWQMPGVTIPMLLLLALGVAETDAYAAGRRQTPHDVATPPGTSDLSRERTSIWASHLFRWIGLGVCVTALIGLGLPYLSLRVQDMSLRNLGSADKTAVGQTSMAARLRPTSAEPFSLRAEIYKDAALAAQQQAVSGGAVALDDLALALAAREDAIARDPAAWALHYHAGLAALDLAQARERAGTSPTPNPGATPESLANTRETRAQAGRYRDLTPEQLRALARRHLEDARQRNPLSPLVLDALASLGHP